MPTIVDVIHEYVKPGYISGELETGIITEYVRLISHGMKPAEKRKFRDNIATPTKIIITDRNLLHQAIMRQLFPDTEDEFIMLKFADVPFLFVENHYLPMVRLIQPIQTMCQDAPDIDIEKVIECTEKRDNVNIVAISNYREDDATDEDTDDFIELVSSSRYSREFHREFPVKLLYYHTTQQWFLIEYYDTQSKTITTYEAMKYPNIPQIEKGSRPDNTYNTITYEPYDVGRTLPIIEVIIGEKPIQLFVGSTYNLYLVSSPEKLVGSLDVSNYDASSGNGTANIRWVKGYPGKL
jgi:hypothetical protein